MNRKMRVLMIAGLLLLVPMLSVAQEPATEPANPSEDAPENLSESRTLGVGIQVDFPWGGLISARTWLSPVMGGEGILFLWGDSHGLEGTATARILYRIADAPVVDFYVAGGATLPFSPGRTEAILISAMGGIEFGFRFARNLAWNIEFGMAASLYGEVMMAFGTGVHFYF